MGEQRKGVALGVAAYLLWGMFPLYWPLLEPSGALEILSHRILWSLVVVGVLLALRRDIGWLRTLGLRRIALLTTAALAVAVNWGTYIYGVNAGFVVETSLGYFINPLVTVAFGVVLLHESLRPAQWIAIGVASVAVIVLTVDYGRPPWIALVLAVSFACYGLLKKTAGVGPVQSLSLETAVLAVPAGGYLLWLSAAGEASFGTQGPGHAVLLAVSGVVTAVPLLCFGGAAIRVPLSTLGLLQYLAPVLQFLLGVLVFREDMPASRLGGFALVWLALMIFTIDALHSARQRQVALAAAAA